MATIKFTTNLHGFQNGGEWNFHPNFFEGKDQNGKQVTKPVPNEPGVYIVGVKIPVNDPPQYDDKGKLLETPHNEKFCPLYVGVQDNLSTKIRGHRNPNNKRTYTGEVNSFKELWNINLEPKIFYRGIEIWNDKWRYSRSNKVNDPNRINQLNVFIKEVKDSAENCLIWFPNSAFFDFYLSINSSNYEENSGHNGSVGLNRDLDTIGTIDAQSLKDLINGVKSKIENNFWYAFISAEEIAQAILKSYDHPLREKANEYINNGKEWTRKETNKKGKNVRKNGPGKTLCESVENATNKALAHKGIYTYAKAHKPKHPYSIDFSFLKNDLVCMQNNPLIINIIP